MLVRTVDKSQIGKDLSGLAKDWTCSLPVVFGGLLVGYSYLFVNSMEHVSYICGYIFLVVVVSAVAFCLVRKSLRRM